MPLVGYYGNSIADRYPTHAEQFNQNVNSQAMNSANLARDSLDTLTHFLANALVFAVQAVELRTKLVADSFDATQLLSPATRPLYAAARAAAAGPPEAEKPLVWNDLDGFIQPKVEGVMAEIVGRGPVAQAVSSMAESLRRHGR
jgi:phenylalanine ammonia-lyase